jgi:hypothetical protein
MAIAAGSGDPGYRQQPEGSQLANCKSGGSPRPGRLGYYLVRTAKRVSEGLRPALAVPFPIHLFEPGADRSARTRLASQQGKRPREEPFGCPGRNFASRLCSLAHFYGFGDLRCFAEIGMKERHEAIPEEIALPELFAVNLDPPRRERFAHGPSSRSPGFNGKGMPRPTWR